MGPSHCRDPLADRVRAPAIPPLPHRLRDFRGSLRRRGRRGKPGAPSAVGRGEGGVDALWWEGDKYPSYIEDVLSKIAPAVEDGSYLDFIGEDTCIWGLRFEKGEMTVMSGEIVFS